MSDKKFPVMLSYGDVAFLLMWQEHWEKCFREKDPIHIELIDRICDQQPPQQ